MLLQRMFGFAFCGQQPVRRSKYKSNQKNQRLQNHDDGAGGRYSNFIRFCLNGRIYRNRTRERCGAVMPGDISATLSAALALKISYPQ